MSSNTEYSINFTDKPSTETIDALCEGLDKHAQQKLGQKSFEPFGFIVNDKNDKLIAGCTGFLIYGVLSIRLLWVDESVRKMGIGQKLIKKAESFAKEKNCRYITIETFNWQAKEFYEKLGYQIEHVYDGYDHDGKFYFFRKKLTSSK